MRDQTNDSDRAWNKYVKPLSEVGYARTAHSGPWFNLYKPFFVLRYSRVK